MNTGTIEQQLEAVVCVSEKDGVTLCEHCGEGAASGRFCSNKCRQAAYRKSSPAYRAYLKRLKEARKQRRADHYQRKNRARALGTFRGYGGPLTPGLPKIGSLELKNYF
jgi:hypothetical protein